MKIRLEKGDFGFCYLLVAEDGRDILVQTDWQYPSVASSFGYVPCECGATDGTVNCSHKTATQMISEAQDYLDEHIGDTIEDPGYFVEDSS